MNFKKIKYEGIRMLGQGKTGQNNFCVAVNTCPCYKTWL